MWRFLVDKIFRSTKKLPYITCVILLSIVLFAMWLFLRLVEVREENIKSVLEVDGVKVEGVVIDNFDYTFSIISNMNAQIKERPYSKQHIQNILEKYKTHPSLVNTFSWTIFSWADENDQITVDALYDIMKKPYDLSNRDYIPLAHKDPGKLYLGEPVIGSTSRKWMIPGGVGLLDKNGRYAGTMTIGFNIDFLAKTIQKNIQNKNVRIALFNNKNNLPILLVSSTEVEYFKDDSGISEEEKNHLLEIARSSKKENVDIAIFGDSAAYLVKDIDSYDFSIVVEYDSKALNNELWTSIWSRSIEILGFILIVSLLIINIYRREKVILALKEKAEKANESKTNLLKTISHDLRNYISGIFGMANIISTHDEDDASEQEKLEQDVKYAKIIEGQSEEMLRFVQNLLDINQAESGMMKLSQLEDCDVAEIINKMLFLNRNFTTKHQVKIIADIEENLPLLKCDRRKFKQILDNLITNAVKYSKRNSEVNIVAKYLQSKNQIYIEIIDNGIGMSKDEVEQAIAGNGISINKSGLGKSVDSHGIGLPLVKMLVDLHNAEIEIESEKDVGTKCKLWFNISL